MIDQADVSNVDTFGPGEAVVITSSIILQRGIISETKQYLQKSSKTEGAITVHKTVSLGR